MRKYLALIVGICIFMSSTLGISASFAAEEESSNTGTLSFATANGEVFVEAEDMTLNGDDVTVMADANASGGKAIKVTQTTDKNLTDWQESDPDSFGVAVDMKEIGQYAVWVRVNAPGASADSFHYSLNGRPWVTKHNDYGAESIVGKGYQWVKLDVIAVSGGAYTFRFRYREPKVMIDKMFLTNDTSIIPTGTDGKAESPAINTEAYWPIPQIKPIAGHPRLFVTSERVEEIKANLTNREWQYAYLKIKEQGNDENLETIRPDNAEAGNYNNSIISKIQARALLWLLGDVDEAHGKKTIQYAREYLSTVSYPNVGDITRAKGNDMVMGAIVYDWCYDLLTDQDKEFFIDIFKYIASIKESHYPPVGTGHQIGEHDGEGEIFKDLLSAGVAVYDEDPEMYHLAAGRLFDQMIESRNVFYHAGRNYNGTSYGIERTRYESYAAMIFDRMGYHDLFDKDEFGTYRQEYGKENLKKMPYTWLYERLPFGLWVKEGNSWLYTNYKYENGYSSADAQMMLNVSGIYDDPYIRGQWVKDLAVSSYTLEPFWNIVMGNPEAEFDITPDELPLTRVSTYPMTHIEARTNWQDGLNGSTVVATMNAYEKRLGEHDHADLGNFSLYYKGTLLMDGGTYNGSTGGWFGTHFMNYMTQSIASNTMNVYKPGETDTWKIAGVVKNIEANTGGQKNQDYIKTIEDFWATEDLAVTNGLFVGPNEKTPEFSYVKTDLSNAYSDKVSDYKRSMVFMNLFDEDYPAAMVVYDNVTTSDSTYKKSFLLHSIEEPVVSGNKSVIQRTEDERFTGKLTNITMLPKQSLITKVGGEGKESWVDGKNYANDAKEGIDDEQGAWRLEISPVNSANNDVFLNAMYVSDGADTDLPELEMIQEEFDNFVGATIKDRMILFSKNAQPVSTNANITVRDNGAEIVSCLITDMAEGVWKVSGVGSVIYAEVKKGENALYFKGAPGAYTLSKADGQKATEFAYPETEFAKSGDFLIYKDNCFIYQAKPTKLIEGVPYIPVKEILGQLGTEVTWNQEEQTAFATKNNHVMQLKAGTQIALYDGSEIKLEYQPRMIDGVLYTAAEDCGRIAQYRAKYDDYANIMTLYDTSAVESMVCDFDEVPAGTELTFVVEEELPTSGTVGYYVNGERKGEVKNQKFWYTIQPGVNEIHVQADGSEDIIPVRTVYGIDYEVDVMYHDIDFTGGELVDKGTSKVSVLNVDGVKASADMIDDAYRITVSADKPAGSPPTIRLHSLSSETNAGTGIYVWETEATYSQFVYGSSGINRFPMQVRNPSNVTLNTFKLDWYTGDIAHLHVGGKKSGIVIRPGDTYQYKVMIDTENGVSWFYLDGKLIARSTTAVPKNQKIGRTDISAGHLSGTVDIFDNIKMYRLKEKETCTYQNGEKEIASIAEIDKSKPLTAKTTVKNQTGTERKMMFISAIKSAKRKQLVWADATPVCFSEGERYQDVTVLYDFLPEDIADGGYEMYHYLWGWDEESMLAPMREIYIGLK